LADTHRILRLALGGTVLAAALLHDTIEDTDTTRIELETEFGLTIVAIVAKVTDDKSLPKAERKRLQVEHATHISNSAKLVKLAEQDLQPS
jgi:(p)ppGpp synthase/HD superfamily hydrolase